MWTIQTELRGDFHLHSAGLPSLVWSHWACPWCPDSVAMHLLSSAGDQGENAPGAGASSAASPGFLPDVPPNRTALLCHTVTVPKLGSNRNPDLPDTLRLPTALLCDPCSTDAPSCVCVKRAGLPQWLPRLCQPAAVTLAQLAPMTDHPIFELFQIILEWNNPSLIGKGPRKQRGSYGCGEFSFFDHLVTSSNLILIAAGQF